jgi:hypothetical protein
MKNKHWAVTILVDGDQILNIESNFLSGKELTKEDEKIIRIAAEHLIAFVGRDKDGE